MQRVDLGGSAAGTTRGGGGDLFAAREAASSRENSLLPASFIAHSWRGAALKEAWLKVADP